MTVPFNILCVSDLATTSFSEGLEHIFGPFLPEEGIGPVLEPISPSLFLKVPDWRATDGSMPEVTVSLRLRSPRSFRPRGISDEVPGLATLIELSERIKDVKKRRAGKDSLVPLIEQLTRKNISALVSEAGEAVSKPKVKERPLAGKEDILDSLFQLVDTGEDTGEEVRESISSDLPWQPIDLFELLHQAGDYLGKAAGSFSLDQWLSKLATACQHKIDQVLSYIYGDDEFRRIERSWFGLKFLLDQVPKGTDVRIYVIPFSGQYGLNVLEELARDKWPLQAAPMPSIILFDWDFDISPPSVQLLQGLSGLAANNMIPVVCSAGLEFFGVDTWEHFNRLAYLPTRFSEPGFAALRSLRSSDDARWIAIGFNQLLLRPLYNRDYIRDGLLFNQPDQQALWGGAVWAIGALVAKGFVASGWPYVPTGPGGIVLEDLSVSPGLAGYMPLRYPVSEQRAMELSDCGLISIVCVPGKDRAWAFSAPVFFGPIDRRDPEIRDQCSLNYQLFITRFLRLLEAATKLIPSELTDSELSVLMTQTIGAWIGDPRVEATVLPTKRGRVLKVKIPRVPHLSGGTGLELETSVPG